MILKRIVFVILLAIAAIALLRSGVAQSTDFEVFYKTGLRLIHHEPIYRLDLDRGMVFKYPPWIAPIFLPFGFFDFTTAKWLWAIFCLCCLAYVTKKLAQITQRSLIQWAPILLSFYGLLIIHFLDGQIVIPILALTLALYTQAKSYPVLLIAWSSKIFTLIPSIFTTAFWFKKKIILTTALICATITLAVFIQTTSDHQPTLTHLFTQWREAATSGSQFLDPGNTRDPKNQNLVNFSSRILGISEHDSKSEIMIALTLILLAYALFWPKLKHRSLETKLFVGLAITPVLHPLSWTHLYLWTLPLVFMQLRRTNVLAWIGFVFIIASDANLGMIGAFLYSHFGKALGTVILCLSVIYFQPSKIGSADKSF